MPNASIADLTAIERQLDKLASTCNSLIMLSNLASSAGNTKQASKLLAKVPELQMQQFLLYRDKQNIVIASPEWQAMKKSIEKVNVKIESDLKDLSRISSTINEVAKAISAAAAVVAVI